MKLTSDIFERLPQVWVLVGLLIIASGLYLGFDYSVVFVYLWVGIICTVYGFALFVILFLDGPRKKSPRPLSRNFISVGPTGDTPVSPVDQEPTSNQ